MIRPENIYLDSPITINGVVMHHTEDGLKYLIDHYTHMLNTPTRNRTQAVEEHMRGLITGWKWRLEVYAKRNIN